MPPGAPCDLVFLDPPYGKSLGHQALRSAWAQGWIAAEAWIIFEEASAMTPEGFVLRDSRKFGGTTMTFLQPIQEAAEVSEARARARACPSYQVKFLFGIDFQPICA